MSWKEEGKKSSVDSRDVTANVGADLETARAPAGVTPQWRLDVHHFFSERVDDLDVERPVLAATVSSAAVGVWKQVLHERRQHKSGEHNL